MLYYGINENCEWEVKEGSTCWADSRWTALYITDACIMMLPPISNLGDDFGKRLGRARREWNPLPL